MKFYITRTSGFVLNENPPTDGATLVNPYRQEGEKPIYTIELDTLDDLVAIIAQAGEPIIIDDERKGMLTIEIYDTYRE